MIRYSLADFLSLAIPARSAKVFLLPNMFGGLRSCFQVDLFLRSHMAGFFGLLLVPKFSLFYRGSKTLGGTDLFLQEIFWEVFSLPSCLLFKIQIISLEISSLLSELLTLVAFFHLYSVEEERIK